MAGIAAMLDQRMGARQGNLNPMLYSLAKTTTNVFHDATPATSGVASCSTAVPSLCNNSTPSASALTGGLAGYALTTGYDLATGLGSLDVANFFTAVAGGSGTSLADTTVSLTASLNPMTTSQTVTFTAMIGSSAAGTPTGTVQFYSNGAPLGSAVSVASGKATTGALSFPAAGTYSIMAVYSGDRSFAKTTSAALSLVVTSAGSFNLTAGSGTITVTSGATTGNTNSIKLTSLNAFAGTVTLGCSVSASAAANQPTCSIAPGSVALAANGTATAVVTLGTTATHTAALRSAGTLSGVALAGFFMVLPFRRRKPLRPLLGVLLLTAGIAGMAGCGKGGDPLSSPTSATVTGSAGTYTVTVTGVSGASTARTAFTFVVN